MLKVNCFRCYRWGADYTHDRITLFAQITGKRVKIARGKKNGDHFPLRTSTRSNNESPPCS